MKKLFKAILARAARQYVARTKPYVIGITGSVGKTTSRMIIAQMLRKQLPGLRIDTSEKNFNSDIGLCLAILGIRSYEPTRGSTLRTIFSALYTGVLGKKRADVMVLEYGIDHPGDMQELISIVKPDIGILTGVDKVHATYFPDASAIFDEKVQLLDATRDVVFYGYPLQELIENRQFSADVLSFALHEDENETDIGFNAYRLRRMDEEIGSEFIVCEGEDRMSTIRANVLGHEHAGYVSLAYQITQIVALRFNQSCETATDVSLMFDLQPGRMSVFAGKRGSILLDSSYNASPGSMKMMIELITHIRQELFPERQLLLCLGEMRELGIYSEEAHTALAQQIIHADHLFLIGTDVVQRTLPALELLGYSSSRVQWFKDSQELGVALNAYLSQQSDLAVVLFKGSQNTIFLEEAVKQVLRYPGEVNKLCRQGARWANKKT